MAADLQIRVAKSGDGSTITVSGEIDISNADAMRSSVRSALDHRTCTTVTLDLGGVTFMDAAGLSALVMINTECTEGSAVFLVTNVPRCVRRLADLGLAELGLASSVPIE